MPELIGQQFGAALEMLENAIGACPEDQWDAGSRYWYIAYHTAFWTDYYLSDTPNENDYRPPEPFTLSEFEDGQLPEREYTKAEVLDLLRHVRRRLHSQLQNNTAEELLERRFTNAYKNYSLFELLLYNMRHVQHHAAQLNLLLRQGGTAPPDWVSRGKKG
jgi:DinB family protein